MKKQILFAGALWISLLGLQTPAQADHDDSYKRANNCGWHTKYDHDNDGKWDYNDFQKAHRDWESNRNPNRAVSDEALRKHYDRLDKNHDGYVSPQEARHYHRWE